MNPSGEASLELIASIMVIQVTFVEYYWGSLGKVETLQFFLEGRKLLNFPHHHIAKLHLPLLLSKGQFFLTFLNGKSCKLGCSITSCHFMGFSFFQTKAIEK